MDQINQEKDNGQQNNEEQNNQNNQYQNDLNQNNQNQNNQNQNNQNQNNQNQNNQNQNNQNQNYQYQNNQYQNNQEQNFTNPNNQKPDYLNQLQNQNNQEQNNQEQNNQYQNYQNQNYQNQNYQDQTSQNQYNRNQYNPYNQQNYGYRQEDQQNVPPYGDPYNMSPCNNAQYYTYQNKPLFHLLQMNDTQQALMNSDVMYQEGLSPKKLLSRAGLALAILTAVVLGIQTIIEALVMYYQPSIADTNWYVWAVTAISLVVIGFPIYNLLMKLIPDSPKGAVVKMKPGRFIMIFFICVAAMYITNFLSTILTYIIAIIKGEELINPAAQAIMNGNFLITLVYAAIVAPIVEELIFRKLLLDKVRRFGDIPAILITGLAFGLFHLNLSQFFYAAVLGFIFAYVTLRTNTVIYSILLHMMINSLSTVITPFVTNMNMFVILGIIAWEFITIAAGVVFFVLNFKKIEIYKTAPVMKTSAYFLNTGTILYTLICIVMIIFMTIV